MVLHHDSHLLVVAGPGTGKTLTLTHRIAYLIRKGIAQPERILALTFTRKAAQEMAQRISKLLDGSVMVGVNVATFHGFCLEMLRSEGDKTGLPQGFTLCPETDARSLAGEVLAGFNANKRTVAHFMKHLPEMKAGSIMSQMAPQVEHQLASMFLKYQSVLRELGMLDLDDLEMETLRLFHDHADVVRDYGVKFPWIFVDEYQDSNPIQVELLKALTQTGKSQICVIGDPDQAIYGFRGSDVGNFRRFKEDFPGAKEIALTRNYRSTKEILQGAAALMGKEKPLACQSPETAPVSFAACRSDSEEAEMIVEQVERLIGGTTYFSLDSGRVESHEEDLLLGFGDIGVLFRLNVQGDALEEALDRAGMPFIRSGETPLIARYPVNILWRFFQTLQYPDNLYYAKLYKQALSTAGITKEPSVEGLEMPDVLSELIDDVITAHRLDCSSDESIETLRRLQQLAANFDGTIEAFLDTLSLERGIDHALVLGDRVALMSIHAAKGLEWPVVFITGCEDQLLPCTLFGNRDEEEERRLFYVAMTRARARLILSHVKRRTLNGRVLTMDPSPFFDDIPNDILIPLERRGWRPRKKSHTQLRLFE